MEWEVGDLIEFDGELFVIGSVTPNKDGNRVVYRLDQKFKESKELIVRNRAYMGEVRP